MQFSLTPDLLFNTRQARQNALLRERLQTAGQEAITGRRADVVEATNGRVGDAFLLEQASAQITRQQGAVDLARARLGAATVSVSLVRETATDFATDGRVVLESGRRADIELMADRASDSLGMVTDALGRRQGTRHLFSGTLSAGGPYGAAADLQSDIDALVAAGPDAATTLAAVDDYFNAPGGAFETGFYQGSAGPGPRLHVSNSQSFDPIPKGDDPTFRDVLHGFALIAAATNAATDEDRDTLMRAGFDRLNSASEDMLTMEASLGASLQGLDRVESGLNAEATLIAATQDSLLGRDVFDAAAELQALEGQLEASYAVTGRLGSLSLTDFLR